MEETLKSFGVDAKVVNVISGPSVTRYEIQPQIGVKVQSITRLTDYIALNMRARSDMMIWANVSEEKLNIKKEIENFFWRNIILGISVVCKKKSYTLEYTY